jgi:hypothetical protein
VRRNGVAHGRATRSRDEVLVRIGARPRHLRRAIDRNEHLPDILERDRLRLTRVSAATSGVNHPLQPKNRSMIGPV